MHVILMGAQGSGKGTQAARLAPRLHLQHLSTGELFRAAIALGSPVGLEIEAAYDRGDLISDDLAVRLVGESLEDLDEVKLGGEDARGALFDGFPRTVNQAKGLGHLLTSRGEEITVVVELVVPMERLVTRLAGRWVCPVCGTTYHLEFNPPAVQGRCDLCDTDLIQREDDKPEPIKRRLALYFEQTAPVLSFYGERGMLVQVNGDQPIDRVTTMIQKEIRSRSERMGQKVGQD